MNVNGLLLTGKERFGAKPSSQYVVNSLANEGFLPAGRNDLKPIKFEMPFDWSMNPYKDPNWQMQLHAWRMLDPLILAHENDYKIESLNMAVNIAEDWAVWITQKKKKSIGRAWYDMAVGLRAAKLAYLKEAVQKNSILIGKLDIIDTLIDMHIEQLMDENNFNLGNHGISQANGLMALSYVISHSHKHKLESEAQAIKMLSLLINSQFDHQGIHREGAPYYHFYSLERFNEILNAPWWQSINTEKIYSKLNLARLKSEWLCSPDGYEMPIGDSVGKKRIKALYHDSYVNNNIEYKLFDNGYNIVRKIGNDKKASSQLFFRTAYDLPVHTHHDLFNIILWHKGDYLITDPGKYGYKKDSPRRYITSSHAHNALTILGNRKKSKPIKSDNFLSTYKVLNNYSLLLAKIHTGGIDYERLVVYIPEAGLLITDKACSSTPQNYFLNWTFGHNWITDNNEESLASVNLVNIVSNEKVSINFFDYNMSPKYGSLAYGQINPFMSGWISGAKYRTLEPTLGICFSSTDNIFELITIVSFVNNDFKIKIDNDSSLSKESIDIYKKESCYLIKL